MVPKVPSGCWLDPGMVGLGGVGGCGCATRHYMPGTATQAAATPVTRAFCLAGHAHAETGNSETGGANRDELLKEAIFGNLWATALSYPATTNSADVFSLFSNHSATGPTCSPSSLPTSSLIQSDYNSLVTRLGQQVTIIKGRTLF